MNYLFQLVAFQLIQFLLILKNVEAYDKETVVYNENKYVVDSNLNRPSYHSGNQPWSHAINQKAIKAQKNFDLISENSDLDDQFGFEQFDPEAFNNKKSTVELNTFVKFTNADVNILDQVGAETESAKTGLVLVEAVDLAKQIIDEEELENSFEKKITDNQKIAAAATALARATAINEICAKAQLQFNMRTRFFGLDEDSNGQIDRTLMADVHGKAVALARAIAEAVAIVRSEEKQLISKVKIDAFAEDIEYAAVKATITKNFTVHGTSQFNDVDQRVGNSSVCAKAVAKVVAEAIAIDFFNDNNQFVDGTSKLFVDGTNVEINEDNKVRAESLDELPDITDSKIRQVLPEPTPVPIPTPGVNNTAFVTPEITPTPVPTPTVTPAPTPTATPQQRTTVVVNNKRVNKNNGKKQYKNQQGRRCGPIRKSRGRC